MLVPWPKGKPHSAETKAKIAKSSSGRKHSEETKAKISAGHLGKRLPNHVKEAIRQARLQESAKLTGEERRKRFASYGFKGKKHSPQAIAKTSAANRGKKRSDEQKAFISEDRKRWWASLSAEERRALGAKVGKSHKGQKRSAETRQKIAEGNQRWWRTASPEEREQRGQAIAEGLKQAWREGRIVYENPTSIELKVQNALESDGVPFVAQKQLGPFRVDFFIPDLRQVIEVNGCYWHACKKCGFDDPFGHRQRDSRKLSWLKKQGYTVVVIWAHDLE